jgi:hypothetical protein
MLSRLYRVQGVRLCPWLCTATAAGLCNVACRVTARCSVVLCGAVWCSKFMLGLAQCAPELSFRRPAVAVLWAMLPLISHFDELIPHTWLNLQAVQVDRLS